jgi:hypothetical protein
MAIMMIMVLMEEYYAKIYPKMSLIPPVSRIHLVVKVLYTLLTHLTRDENMMQWTH